MELLRPNSDRARNAILMIWVVVAVEIVGFVSNIMQYNLLTTVRDGGFITDEEANANDLRAQVIAIVFYIAMVASAFTFIQWFRRAYYNIREQVGFLSYSDGWAAGSWFVPILNLFRPYQIMNELYHETNLLLIKRGFGYSNRLSTNIVGWWWTAWLVYTISSRVVNRVYRNAETIDPLISSTVAEMVVNILVIPAGILATKVIRDYSRVEPLLHELTLDLDPAPTASEPISQTAWS